MRLRLADQINSISIKVLLAFVVGMVLSVSLLALLLLGALMLQSNIFSESDISKYSSELAESLQFDDSGRPVHVIEDDNQVWLFEIMSEEAGYRVINQSGKVMLYSKAGEAFWTAVGISQPITAGSFTFEQNGIVMDGSIRVTEHQGQHWFFQAAVSRRFMNFAHSVFALRFVTDGLIILSVVMFGVFGACAHFTLRHTLKPLRELSESAALISPRSLQARLKEDHVPAEIAPLVKSFNTVLYRVEHGYRVQQEFLATAAHELKTPLALIRAQLELMQASEERDWLLHDVSYMSRQVQQLLLLAEASEQLNYKFSTVVVSQAAAETVAYLQRMADTAQVRLRLNDHSDGAKWQADKGALFTLLKNLIENAIQHAPKDSEVQIGIEADKITVRDWGPGTNDEQLKHLFERFWRGAHRRDHGAGLGLAICKEIVQAHGWDIVAYRAEPGLIFAIIKNATIAYND